MGCGLGAGYEGRVRVIAMGPSNFGRSARGPRREGPGRRSEPPFPSVLCFVSERGDRRQLGSYLVTSFNLFHWRSVGDVHRTSDDPRGVRDGKVQGGEANHPSRPYSAS